jgi:hypothetical protein
MGECRDGSSQATQMLFLDENSNKLSVSEKLGTACLGGLKQSQTISSNLPFNEHAGAISFQRAQGAFFCGNFVPSTRFLFFLPWRKEEPWIYPVPFQMA